MKLLDWSTSGRTNEYTVAATMAMPIRNTTSVAAARGKCRRRTRKFTGGVRTTAKKPAIASHEMMRWSWMTSSTATTAASTRPMMPRTWRTGTVWDGGAGGGLGTVGGM